MKQRDGQAGWGRCYLCRGTGAANPDAEHSMDWRDYLPCIACNGTGFVRVKPKVTEAEEVTE